MIERYKYVIGIDGGVSTGMACWNVDLKHFVYIRTVKLHELIVKLSMMKEAADRDKFKFLVRTENPNTYFGFDGKKHDYKAQGAGSIKRDFSVLVDACNDWDIPLESFKLQGTLKKLNKVPFNVMTGWAQDTSVHARDAAMMCWEHDGFIKPLKKLRK